MLGRLTMSDIQVERILKNTRFTMEMEGFALDIDQENRVRKILNGELKLEEYLESINQKAQKYAHEV
jgi:hypothetical protein